MRIFARTVGDTKHGVWGRSVTLPDDSLIEVSHATNQPPESDIKFWVEDIIDTHPDADIDSLTGLINGQGIGLDRDDLLIV